MSSFVRSRPAQFLELLHHNHSSAFDLSYALHTAIEATGGSLYLFGGLMRHTLLGVTNRGDLDLVVPNGSVSLFERFSALGVPLSHNDQGHHRYSWNKLQVDVCTPEQFRPGLSSIDGILEYIDLQINALAYDFKTGELIHAPELEFYQTRYPVGVNWRFWQSAPLLRLQICSIRLAKILHDNPQLYISASDVSRITTDILPQLSLSDWKPVQKRFPLGCDRFLTDFTGILATRVG